jgi:hypothetical protein
MKYFRRYALLFLLSLVSVVHAQTSGQYVWEEFARRIESSEKVSALGSNVSGDELSLSNGALSFSAVDASVAGSSGLEVAFRRQYSVFSRKDYGDLGALGDWTLDMPSISAVFAPDWLIGVFGSLTPVDSRCSVDGSPYLSPQVGPNFNASDFGRVCRFRCPAAASCCARVR